MSALDHHIEDHAGILPERAPAGSLLAALSAKRDELAERGPKQETKLVPEWEGSLRIVYRYPAGGSDPIIKAAERAQARGKSGDVFDANCDTLIACWYDIEGRAPGGDWQPLDSTRPTGCTRRLADMLQIEVPESVKSPARHIIRHVFSPQASKTGVFQGDIGLMTQAGQLIAWLNGAERSADEALAGE